MIVIIYYDVGGVTLVVGAVLGLFGFGFGHHSSAFFKREGGVAFLFLFLFFFFFFFFSNGFFFFFFFFFFFLFLSFLLFVKVLGG